MLKLVCSCLLSSLLISCGSQDLNPLPFSPGGTAISVNKKVRPPVNLVFHMPRPARDRELFGCVYLEGNGEEARQMHCKPMAELQREYQKQSRSPRIRQFRNRSRQM